jgi:hypothetical protein
VAISLRKANVGARGTTEDANSGRLVGGEMSEQSNAVNFSA